MTIYFSEIFKKLRKGRGMTQEQVAEVLSVSPQAVSRWETGATYPDIALLPSIAEFFETTVDALLGTGKARAKERIDGFLRHCKELLEAGDLTEAIDLMRSAVREFPNSFELQYSLVETLLKGYESGYHKDITESEVSELGERILTYSTDDRIRLLTKVYLGRFYASFGRIARATEIFMSLPEAEFCRENQFLLTGIQEGFAGSLNAAPKQAAHKEDPLTVDAAVLSLFRGMYRSAASDQPKDRLAEAKRYLQILDSIYAEKDYDGHYWELAALCTAYMAECYAENKDDTRALLCVSKAVECAEEFTLKPLSDALFLDSEGSEADPRALLKQIRDDFLVKPCFDEIRNHPDFPTFSE
jgi:transcriptional regulator with XRE-family HTH domain